MTCIPDASPPLPAVEVTIQGRRVLRRTALKHAPKKKVALQRRPWHIIRLTRARQSAAQPFASSCPRVKLQHEEEQVLRFGLPKGSLQEATIEKMAKAGFNISVSSRSYIPYVDDEELEIRLIRAQEISRYVEHGYLDCGITGYDWIQENGSKVHEVGEFQFNKATRQTARWVLAVPEDSPIKSVKDLQGKRIATELVNQTRKYLRRHKVKAEVEFSWGATEMKAHELVDAIVDITETGSSLRANKLRIVDTLLSFHPAANRQPRRLEGRLEAAEDRDAGVAAQRRPGCGSESRAEDEHRPEEPGEAAANPARAAQPNHFPPQPGRLGGGGNDH